MQSYVVNRSRGDYALLCIPKHNEYESDQQTQLNQNYLVYFKVAPRQTISAAVLPKVRTPLVLHYSHARMPVRFAQNAVQPRGDRRMAGNFC